MSPLSPVMPRTLGCVSWTCNATLKEGGIHSLWTGVFNSQPCVQDEPCYLHIVIVILIRLVCCVPLYVSKAILNSDFWVAKRNWVYVCLPCLSLLCVYLFILFICTYMHHPFFIWWLTDFLSWLLWIVLWFKYECRYPWSLNSLCTISRDWLLISGSDLRVLFLLPLILPGFGVAKSVRNFYGCINEGYCSAISCTLWYPRNSLITSGRYASPSVIFWRNF